MSGVTEFFACEHPMHVKYVVSGRGIVCTACDPNWRANPWLEVENPASTARFRETFDRVAALLTPLPMTDEDWADTEA